jgi:hypothetical protein
MNTPIRVAIAFSGLVLLGLLPWIWQAYPILAYILLIPIPIWAIWLMVMYLRWARRLGR